MEEYTAQSAESDKPEPMIFTEEIRSYIYDTARWAKFLAIVGFVLTAIMLLMVFFMGSLMQSDVFKTGEMASQFEGMLEGTFTIVFLFYALLIFVPSFHLFKYATSAINGVLYMDQEAMTVSASKLKSVFKFWGILMLIILSLNIIGFIGTLIGGRLGS